MTNTHPTIDHILTAFFEAKLDQKKGLTRSRIEEVDRELRLCLEAEAHRVLETADLVLLAAEREFLHDGAVARTMSPSDLIFVLPIFLSSDWLAGNLVQRRVQLSLVEGLTAYVINRRLIDRYELSCPLLDIRYVLDSERSRIRALRRESAAERMSSQ